MSTNGSTAIDCSEQGLRPTEGVGTAGAIGRLVSAGAAPAGCTYPPKASSRVTCAAMYGTSPYRYSLLRRLDFARDGLRRGEHLVDLALAAGFADQAHFTRMFASTF